MVTWNCFNHDICNTFSLRRNISIMSSCNLFFFPGYFWAGIVSNAFTFVSSFFLFAHDISNVVVLVCLDSNFLYWFDFKLFVLVLDFICLNWIDVV